MDAGLEALQGGDRVAAARWLERAHRLAPKDWPVTFLLASALAGLDDARSLALLRDVAAAQPLSRPAWIGLAAASMRAGLASDAAEVLQTTLSRFAVTDSGDFAEVAARICIQVDAPGWCGLDHQGRLRVVRLPRHRPGSIQVEQGGQRLASLRAGDDPALDITAPGSLTVLWRQRPLLGSGLDPARQRTAQGCVELQPDGSVKGWAWTPWDPDHPPTLAVAAEGQPPSCMITPAANSMAGLDGGLTVRWLFQVEAARLPASGTIRVVGADGTDLTGSPLCLDQGSAASKYAAAALARAYPVRGDAAPIDRWRPLPVPGWPPPSVRPQTRLPAKRGIDVVIPVFRGAADLRACLLSLRRSLPRSARVVLVDDASPDPDLQALLGTLAGMPRLVVLRHDCNRGFPAAANTGMRYALADPDAPRDVLLLNPDTLAPPRLLPRLARLAYASPDTGSVTPLTNDGTIVSYPAPDQAGPSPDLAGTDRQDAQADAANGDAVVDLPTAVGFCMFIRHDCLAQTGLFRDDAFAQGYGEENDWCLRARHLGWRHVAAPGVFVAHAGGQSFGPAKAALIIRNLQVLERLHPGYAAEIAIYQGLDPLAPFRRRLDTQAWAAGALDAGSVVLVSHALGGGVQRFLTDRCGQLRRQGLRPILLTPHKEGCAVSDSPGGPSTNLRYHFPEDWPAVLALLRSDRPRWVELHHLLGHADELAALPAKLGLPYDVFVHDFHFWCPRITLCGRTGTYCGEPEEAAACDACIAELGSRLSDGGRKGDTSVAALRAGSAVLMRSARRVFAPTADTARRIARYVPGLEPLVTPWEPAEAMAPVSGLAGANAAGDARLCTVLVPGAIGADKGFDVLLGCARDAASRALPLRFVVAGHTMNDDALMQTGRVFVTGEYSEDEAVPLMRRQGADFGFIPSVWPETWCYTLSALWQAGLHAAAFGLGAQAERIGASGRGITLPLGLPPSRLNDQLLRYGALLKARSGPKLGQTG